MPMTPEMGPDRRQQYLQAQGQSAEDRIRALMQGLAAGAGGGFIQKMPFKTGIETPGPTLERGPYNPNEQAPGPYIKKMPYRPASPYMHKTVPRDIRID